MIARHRFLIRSELEDLGTCLNARTVLCNLCGGSERDLVYEHGPLSLVRCTSCGLVYQPNPPADEWLESFYSFEAGYHRGFAEDPELIRRHAALAQRHVDQLAEFRRPPGKLLDVGCAAGFFLDRARLAGWEVTGIEVSRDTAEIARERYGVEVQTGRLESAVLEAGSFDCVTMWDVIEHLPDPAGSLARARDLLVAGGLLAIVTPNIEGLYPRASLPLGRRVGWWPHAGLPGHLFQFGEGPLRRMLEAHGFAVSAVRHRRIPLFFDHRGSILRVAFAAAFSPSWVVGPWVRRGDEILVAATRR